MKLAKAISPVPFALCLLAPPALGQDASDLETIDIRETTCRMLLTFDGEEEERTMIFFHGYISGAKGEPIVDVAAFSEASAAITDICIDNPEMSLLDVFTSNR
ncbi:MAG: HdeA/HdeB family chaperone [Pseudomonadota bacterium]